MSSNSEKRERIVGPKTASNPEGTISGEFLNLLCWAREAVAGFSRWNETGFDDEAGQSYRNLSEAVKQAEAFLKEIDKCAI